METIKIPNDASEEAKICLTCTEKQCVKNALNCKRYNAEKKKIGKRTNNVVKRKNKEQQNAN